MDDTSLERVARRGTETTPGSPRAIDRRQMLKRSAVAGAAVVWAVPAIELITSTAASATSPSTTVTNGPDGCAIAGGLDYIASAQIVYSTEPPGSSGATFYELDVTTTVTAPGSTNFDSTCTWSEVTPTSGQSVTIANQAFSLSPWPSYWPASTFSDFQSRQGQVQGCSNYQQPVVVFQSGIGPVDVFSDNANTNVTLYPVAVAVTGPVAGDPTTTTTLGALVPSSADLTTVTGITVTLDPVTQTLSFATA